MIDISVSGLVKEFEVGKKILDGLTFQVDAGERVGLLGPNGCGKTTFLRILTGEVHPDEGDIVVAPNKRMGLISQIPVYPAGYTVEDVLDTAFAPLHEMEEEMTQRGVALRRSLLTRLSAMCRCASRRGGIPGARSIRPVIRSPSRCLPSAAAAGLAWGFLKERRIPFLLWKRILFFLRLRKNWGLYSPCV